MANRSAHAKASPSDLTALHRQGQGLGHEAHPIDLAIGERPTAAGNQASDAADTGTQNILNPADINALRRVHCGLANFLPGAQRMRLIAVGLIALTGAGRLVLTQGGKERLACEKASSDRRPNDLGRIAPPCDGKARRTDRRPE
ncbi:MAG: hypothetical protein EPO10_26380 [Reyranella sp.]|nr:MAG: hypothetical protein EPO10_26380 [Reyranella sp.]